MYNMKTKEVDVKIKNPDGSIVFQKDKFKVPEDWSYRAATIVASKYAMDSEDSAIDIVDRVVDQITTWGEEEQYLKKPNNNIEVYESINDQNSNSENTHGFSYQLKDILLNQRAAFNSPVWFNCGSDTGTNQMSGCFIVPVEDNMESILNHNTVEGLIFRGGSGAGCNVSTLRAKGEKLSNKGIASGPLSFMTMWDRTAGAIRSGGKTRRSAKMICMDADHPDIMDFIECKKAEEKKAKMLIKAGVSPEEAYATVAFQNTNHSIRVTDEFMSAVEKDETYTLVERNNTDNFTEVKAKDIFRKAAEVAWETGDPGIQFDTTMNNANPVPSMGHINSTNPCSEFSAIDNSSCNLASLNLLKYWDKDEYEFNWALFEKDIRILVTAMDILVTRADYPTEAITETTKKTRPLGLGFANLGALLMIKGLSYDSKKARDFAADITKFMTTVAYTRSNELGILFGSFDGYHDNLKANYELILRLTGDRELAQKINKSELRNSQVTLLAPTGCLTGDSLILSSEGLLPIEDLGHGEEKWQEIDITVLQEEGAFNSNKFYRNGTDNTLTVTTKKGHEINCTEKHKFRVIDEEGHYIWKKAKELKETDTMTMRLGGHEEVLKDKKYLVLRHPTKEDTDTILVNEHFANVIGYYMGDGYLKETGGVHFVINNEDSDLLDVFEKWATKTNTRITKEKREGCFVAHNNSRATYKWFNEFGFAKEKGNKGEGAASAFVPIHILSSKTSVLAAFLSGLFEADGTISFGSKTPTIELCTVSKTLAIQVMTAMESLGIPIKLKSQEPREDSKGNRIKYRVQISSLDGVFIFAEKIGFLSNRKQSKLNDWIRAQDTNSLLTANHSRHLSVSSSSLIEDLYELSNGLSNEIRQDIAARKQQGRFNLKWAWRIINSNDQLKESKIQKLIELSDLGNLQFVPIESIKENGIQETYDISVPENNTYIANSFITHNTISFMMDCDTTGIEPLFALKTIKTLAGGGTLKIDYPCVQEAIENLKTHSSYYSDMGDKEIMRNNSDIFLTANDIPWKAHIDMMAACQQHLNGAISKTVNMPAEATVKEIEEAYMYAWKEGLKCLAIYRDGSKGMQPIKDANKKEQEATVANSVIPGIAPSARLKPTEERNSITLKIDIGGHEGYAHAGMYPDGSLCEIFIKMSKEGSLVSGMMDAFATSLSLGLQHGVPLSKLVEKFKNTQFQPSGWSSHPDIGYASSIVDYIFKWLELRFLQEEEDEEDEVVQIEKPKENLAYDGPECPVCGNITSKVGTCYLCNTCGNTSGCS